MIMIKENSNEICSECKYYFNNIEEIMQDMIVHLKIRLDKYNDYVDIHENDSTVKLSFIKSLKNKTELNITRIVNDIKKLNKFGYNSIHEKYLKKAFLEKKGRLYQKYFPKIKL